MEWRPRMPANAKVISAERNGRVEWVGIVTGATPKGSNLEVKGLHVNVLLDSMPFRFSPPAIHRATRPRAFEHWWRRLQYVFGDLEDPLLFPPLVDQPTALERAVLDRYVTACSSICACGVVNDGGEVALTISGDEFNTETVEPRFPRVDLTVGFSTLLRQCYAVEERASFKRVKDILWVITSRLPDEHTNARLTYLKTWYAAGVALRNKSVDQLIRDCYVAREGWELFDYTEGHAPDALFNLYNYGDLIHWDRHADDLVKPDDDAYLAATQTSEFFGAAIGIAHLYIGFGELVRAALTPPSTLLTASR